MTPTCRICNSKPEHQTVRANYVYGGKEEHNFWHCQHCDAVYLYPIPSIKEEKFFYRREFEKFMDTRSGQDRDWSGPESHIKTNQDQVKRRLNIIGKHFQSGMELLEIGCSSGFMLNAFRDAGLHCMGIEPSGEFIDFLKRNQHIAYESINDLKSHFPQKQFDLLVHFFVFEHIRDPFSFLQETLKLLKQGGKIIAEIPCVNDPLTSLYDIPTFEKFYWSIAHHYYYSPKSLSFILDKLGVKYQLIPEQRYDLSNHITWMTKGIPGGQGKFNHIFSEQLINSYKQDLMKSWKCDTIFLLIET